MTVPRDWWEPQLRPALSQGDVLGSIPFEMPTWPTVFLKHTSLKGGVDGWAQSNEPARSKVDQKTYILATFNGLAGLAISHDCEIDKPGSTRVLVAPVIPLSTLEESTQQLVIQQRIVAMIALPSIPPESTNFYADLRLISPVPRQAVDASQRRASMTDAARTLLHARLVAFFLDRNMEAPRP